jgi:predicted kinase
LSSTNIDKIEEAEQENGIKPQVLNDAVRILKRIVGLNISSGIPGILDAANNILDNRNRKSWRNIAVSY